MLYFVRLQIRNYFLSTLKKKKKKLERECAYLICQGLVYFGGCALAEEKSPESVRFDIFAELYDQGWMSLLWNELSCVSTFLSLLRVGDRRRRLHRIFQSVIDHDYKESTLNFSSFLSEAALLVPLFSFSLLHNVSAYCEFAEASDYMSLLKVTPHPHPAAVYCQFSSSCFDKSEYPEAFRWSRLAIQSLSNDLPIKVVIDVLRQSSKSYVIRRQFSKAKMLILEAILLSKETYGEWHPKYADCLLDYGYYLLNADRVIKSLQAYQSALEVRLKCFGSQNLQVAFALEGLAYTTYVNQYNTGQFERAKSHAEKAIGIMNNLLPKSHLLLASSQRVLALILEEIAVDHADEDISRNLLNQAESLHRSAIQLSIKSFGEVNVQTAKHYGNLEIKEKLLGNDDHEVALSVGHLASLYTYDLKEYSKAELLYLRSIEIGIKLFGPGYSGLEYDYRGIIRVYQEIEDWPNYFVYTYKLREWEELQGLRNHDEVTKACFSKGDPLPLSSIIQALDDNGMEDSYCSSNTWFGGDSLKIERRKICKGFHIHQDIIIVELYITSFITQFYT
ncbi:Amyloid protein-binding protein 2 [Lepeophtheirus salmonis]|uniref:Amyloid protein-binding protein 2 n=1 Tax=Lepeophtheirus salmonis TaxID=72036 RepID=A0A7R8CHC0_LEPSM|nr:Amyloid protein-binding protein 2 [Lepeophtheirus salmonis]CAF2778879.1 Amyloid protein-binding protein 2 [Lepeophtheirus salmonis]